MRHADISLQIETMTEKKNHKGLSYLKGTVHLSNPKQIFFLFHIVLFVHLDSFVHIKHFILAERQVWMCVTLGSAGWLW